MTPAPDVALAGSTGVQPDPQVGTSPTEPSDYPMIDDDEPTPPIPLTREMELEVIPSDSDDDIGSDGNASSDEEFMSQWSDDDRQGDTITGDPTAGPADSQQATESSDEEDSPVVPVEARFRQTWTEAVMKNNCARHLSHTAQCFGSRLTCLTRFDSFPHHAQSSISSFRLALDLGQSHLLLEKSYQSSSGLLLASQRLLHRILHLPNLFAI